MSRRELRAARARERRLRRALLFGARAPFWLGAAAALSLVAAAVFVLVGPEINAALSWTALGMTVGLFAGMVMIAVLLPVTIRRATLLAWFLSGLVVVSLGGTGVLVYLDTLV